MVGMWGGKAVHPVRESADVAARLASRTAASCGRGSGPLRALYFPSTLRDDPQVKQGMVSYIALPQET